MIVFNETDGPDQSVSHHQARLHRGNERTQTKQGRLPIKCGLVGPLMVVRMPGMPFLRIRYTSFRIKML